jgi:hypothetical protein
MTNILTKAFCFTAVVVLMALPCVHAVTITDDFSDLDDTANPAWTHLTGDANSTGQTYSAATGEYNITAQNNGITLSGNQYGFAGSHTGAAYTDVNVMADLVQPANGLFYGVAARLNGNNAFNALQGYAYAFEQKVGSPIGVGEMVMFRINGLAIDDIGNDGDAVRLVTLDLANKDYTLSLDIVGANLYGRVTEVGSGIVVAYQAKTDATFASGTSGVVGLGARSTTLPLEFPLNFTVDNFKTSEVPEPATTLLIACGAAGAMLVGRRRRQLR